MPRLHPEDEFLFHKPLVCVRICLHRHGNRILWVWISKPTSTAFIPMPDRMMSPFLFSVINPKLCIVIICIPTSILMPCNFTLFVLYPVILWERGSGQVCFHTVLFYTKMWPLIKELWIPLTSSISLFYLMWQYFVKYFSLYRCNIHFYFHPQIHWLNLMH